MGSINCFLALLKVFETLVKAIDDKFQEYLENVIENEKDNDPEICSLAYWNGFWQSKVQHNNLGILFQENFKNYEKAKESYLRVHACNIEYTPSHF